jgi:hypothetical protein
MIRSSGQPSHRALPQRVLLGAFRAFEDLPQGGLPDVEVRVF